MRTLEEIIAFLRNKKVLGTNFNIESKYLLHKLTFTPDLATTIKVVEKLSGDFALFVKAIGPATVLPIYNEGKIELGWLSAQISSQPLPLYPGKYTVPLGLLADGAHRNISLPHAPHIMVAGTTGSGKSYWMHGAIRSCLAQGMHVFAIDPKWGEFSKYRETDRFYHIRDAQQTMQTMQLLLDTMDSNYQLFYKKNCNSITEYNEKFAPLNPVILFVDELSDLVLTCGSEFTNMLLRLAQKGRAAGIHLICATQAPTAKLLSGELKANFPVRVAFKTSSAVASRVVLDSIGAEKLAGQGDGICLTENGEYLRFRGYRLPDTIDLPKISLWTKVKQAVGMNEPLK